MPAMIGRIFSELNAREMLFGLRYSFRGSVPSDGMSRFANSPRASGSLTTPRPPRIHTWRARQSVSHHWP